MVRLKMGLVLSLLLLTSGVAVQTPSHAAPSGAGPQSVPDQDTDSSFFENEPEPPADAAPETEDSTPPEDAGPTEPALPEPEYANPNDSSDLEYADEAEKREADEKKRREEQLKHQRAEPKVKPPVEEPMPLIRRKRQQAQFPTKQPPKYIKHPYAEKGLTKITRDKMYIYKVPKSPQTQAASVRFGIFNPTKLRNPDTETTFAEFYGSSSPAGLFDYEWQFFRNFGKMAIKLGTGLALASGHGEFKNPDDNPGVEPLEKFTFAVFPNSMGLIYRAQFWDKQKLIPYGEGGGTIFTFGEFRDDGKAPKFGGAFGAYAGAGCALNMNLFDSISMLQLDRDYGINNVYLAAEYRAYLGFGRFDFSANFFNGGFIFEF